VDFVIKTTIDIDGQPVETTARLVRSADKYTVADEINRGRSKIPRALVVIKADAHASFGVMQDVMESMQENYLERFLIITDHELEES